MPVRLLAVALAVLAFHAFTPRHALAQLSDTAEEDDRFGQVMAAGDFNGDGWVDMAFGVPDEDVDGMADAGAVHVVYGTETGLDEANMQFWNQNDKGLPNEAQIGDNFGASLAAGDFNDDGFDDLAIGVPGERFGDVNEAGAVLVLLGSERGLSTGGDQFLSQTVPGMPDQAEDNDRFGAALAAGDFDGDGVADLVVGIPGENVGSVIGAGAVHLFFGDGGGFDPAASQFITQQTDGVPDAPEGGDGLGATLAAGNLNGDAYDDLVAGVPEEDIGEQTDAGAVHVFYGSADGLDLTAPLFLHQNAADVDDEAAAFEQFGFALAVGDFNGDGTADLAVGVPFEDGSQQVAGSVQVLYGSATGVSGADDEHWNQDTASMAATAGLGDLFGMGVAAGDFNGDTFDDLAVGTPGKARGALTEAGGVYVVYGSADGLTGEGRLFWEQSDGGRAERTEMGDFVGASLFAGDLDGDGFADLLVGATEEDAGGVANSGRTHLLAGSAGGLQAQIVRDWAQNSLPEAPFLIDPEDGTTLTVGGDATPVDPATPFLVRWTAANDPDGHTVTYYWQLSLTPTFNLMPLNVPVGTATEYATTVGEVGALMRGIGIMADSTFTFYHRVIATDGIGQRTGPVFAVHMVRGQIVNVEGADVPTHFALAQNYPNPFNPTTTIAYDLPEAAAVRVEVYNQLGQRVRLLSEPMQPAGSHTLSLDMGDLPSGVYLYRVEAGPYAATRRMVLVK